VRTRESRNDDTARLGAGWLPGRAVRSGSSEAAAKSDPAAAPAEQESNQAHTEECGGRRLWYRRTGDVVQIERLEALWRVEAMRQLRPSVVAGHTRFTAAAAISDCFAIVRTGEWDEMGERGSCVTERVRNPMQRRPVRLCEGP